RPDVPADAPGHRSAPAAGRVRYPEFRALLSERGGVSAAGIPGMDAGDRGPGSLHLRRARVQEPAAEEHRVRGDQLRSHVPAGVFGRGDDRGHQPVQAHAMKRLIAAGSDAGVPAMRGAGGGPAAPARTRADRETRERLLEAGQRLVEQGVRPRIEYLSGVVAEILGAAPSDVAVLRCVASIQAQSFAYLPNPIAARLGLVFKPSRAHIDAVARHIADFSLAGVHAIRRREKRWPDPS